jgi:tetratricopeptide (TPR) repeat protein
MSIPADLRPARPRLACAIQAIVICAAAVWAFWPALRGAWIWDDGLEVADNPLVHGSEGWWKAWAAPYGMDYLPLKGTLQWVQWHLWGAHVLGYHASNLALHICGSLLLWRVLGKLGVGLAWIGGLLFAIHPMAVESVAWISEFKNTLSFPAVLLALCFYMDWDARPGAPACKRPYALSLLCFTAAMLCKTSVVLFPFFLLVLAFWRRGRIGAGDLSAAAPFFGVSLVLGIVALKFQWERAMGLAAGPGGWRPMWGQAGWSILAYLRSSVLPMDLAPVYAPFGPSLPGSLPWLMIGAVMAVFWIRRKAWGRHALLGSGWFLINLVPVIGLIPIAYLRVGPRADHLGYLSLAAVAGGAAAGFGALWTRAEAGPAAVRATLACAALAACLALLAGSRAYAAIFRDEGSFWGAAAEREPGAWLARSNRGRVLLGEGNFGSARVELAEAARLNPGSAEVHANLGDALDSLGRPTEAMAEYRTAVGLSPEFAGGHYDLGRALLLSGRTAEAADELRNAVRIDPGYAVAHNNLGLALARLGLLDEAIVEYRAALRCDPGMREARLNVGNALFRLGRAEDAVAEYRAALRQDPDYAAAHRNLATALESLGRAEEARLESEAAAAAPVR